MNCDWAKADIVLYLYDELADDARFELEQHLRRCAACTAELEAARAFKSSISALPATEPSPNLLTASRLRLQQALETAEQYRGWRRFVPMPTRWMSQLKLAPALAALIFIVGFGAGIGTSYRLGSGGSESMGISGNAGAPAAGAATPAVEAPVLGITAINQQPGSKYVDIRYDAVVPHHIRGSVEDPRIQQFLMLAARNNDNSGLRMDSVDLLTQTLEDEQVREALVFSLHYDNNPGVRLKSLEGLGPFVKGDIRVRNAILDALLSDSNPGVRTEAIQMLRPVRADASVQDVLRHLAGQDQNVSIRNLSRAVLASTPPID